jgi:protoporphyrinogen oxidase
MHTLILGGGVTGLAAGCASGLPIFEASTRPGGICSSYYMRPGGQERLPQAPSDGEAYRFEIGGGHWIFGGDATVLRFIESLTSTRNHARKSGVWFAKQPCYVPYPLQNHLRSLPVEVVCQAVKEMVAGKAPASPNMHSWLLASFGPTLCQLFFDPFHELYTAGLHRQIAPQDGHKSPVDLALVVAGAFGEVASVGYNTTYLYPSEGLDALAERMAARCDIHFGKRAVKIDVHAKQVFFADGSSEAYEALICTLPLNETMAMAGLTVDESPDPATSVLVLNLGARRGPRCPDDHWLYHPRTRAGFHRVGFYSNVDTTFLPRSAREKRDHVSIYVERSFRAGQRPSEAEIQGYAQGVVAELTDWGFIVGAEVVDPTWIDVAYTWSMPGSHWKSKAIQCLQGHDVYMVGRYARWAFQGIAESIRDGLCAGASLVDRPRP